MNSTKIKETLQKMYPDHHIGIISTKPNNFWKQELKMGKETILYRQFSPQTPEDKPGIGFYVPTTATVQDRQGRLVEVTDLEDAIKQCKEGIFFHDMKERRNDSLQFPEAKKDYEYLLRQLEGVERNRKNNL